MTLRYPEVCAPASIAKPCFQTKKKHPTADEREALNSYFHLSARLYPCGECATEFQALLQKYPPQVKLLYQLTIFTYLIHSKTDLIKAIRFSLVRTPPDFHLFFFFFIPRSFKQVMCIAQPSQ